MPREIARKYKRKLVGELCRHQILTYYGCGALVDFPRFSGIMAGLDNWPIQMLPETAKIHERNLETMLGKEFFYQVISPENDFDKAFSIPAYRFPSWYYCPECHRLDRYNKIAKPISGKSSDLNSPLICNYCSDEIKQVKLIPSRFVVSCLNGHLDDFPYVWWTHRKHGICDNPKLKLEYKGSTGDFGSIHICCETCKQEVTMKECMNKDALAKIKCSCKMPWLGFEDGHWFTDPKECNETPRVIQRSANNVYYPVNKSALTIPPWSEQLQSVFASKDMIFKDIFGEEDKEEIVRRLKKQFAKDAELYGENESAFIEAAFHRYRDIPENVNEKSLRMDEYMAFCGEDIDDDLFKTESVEVPSFISDYISQIKLVKKLREVVVLQGFRRILPGAEDLGSPNEVFSPISKHPMNWLPGIEFYGEGIFIKLNKEKVAEWERVNANRYFQMAKRYESGKWIKNEMFDGKAPRFVLLHTLSHLLIKQLTEQCGYTSASIKEKIYSTMENKTLEMCGILIYTSTTGTDGSLGGLVREGYTDRMKTTFENMLQESSWCSNDPLCIESKSQGFMGLNYSACHACALLPETSCEAMNCFLDRASVVGTPDNKNVSYFCGMI